MKEAQNNTLGVLTIISVAFLILFLFVFLLTSYSMKIQRIPLTNTLFDNTKCNFRFDNLSNNVRFNVKLRLIKRANVDYMPVIKQKRNFGIKVALTDSKDRLIGSKDINKDTGIPYSFARDYIELTLASFEAKHSEIYHLQLQFNNDDHFFDLFENRRNELFVQEDFDYAAMPLISAIHSISTVLLSVSFLSSAITIILLSRKKVPEEREQ